MHLTDDEAHALLALKGHLPLRWWADHYLDGGRDTEAGHILDIANAYRNASVSGRYWSGVGVQYPGATTLHTGTNWYSNDGVTRYEARHHGEPEELETRILHPHDGVQFSPQYFVRQMLAQPNGHMLLASMAQAGHVHRFVEHMLSARSASHLDELLPAHDLLQGALAKHAAELPLPATHQPRHDSILSGAYVSTPENLPHPQARSQPPYESALHRLAHNDLYAAVALHKQVLHARDTHPARSADGG